MKRNSLGLLLACGSLSIGCGHVMQPRNVPIGLSPDRTYEAFASDDGFALVLPSTLEFDAKAKRAQPMSVPGDFVSYRYSGSYRSAPVTMTQRLVAREHGYLLLDVTITDEGEPLRLRVRIGDTGDRVGELVSVARLDGTTQLPFGVDAYNKLISSIVLAADHNEGLVDANTLVVQVGADDLYCDVRSYAVRVGDEPAVMTTVRSDDFVWGDVSGEMMAKDGSLIYKAEIIDIGGQVRSHVAQSEEDVGDTDYDHFEQ